jgi:PEGA domain
MNQLARLRQYWSTRSKGGTLGNASGPMDADPDPLLAFATESVTGPQSGPAGPETPAPKWKLPAAPRFSVAKVLRAPHRSAWPAWSAVTIALVAVLGGVAWVYARWNPVTAAEPRPATLRLDTQPGAAEVLIDGQPRGITPLSVSLSSGTHVVTLRHGAEQRVLSVALAAGADVTHHVELKTPDQSGGSTGGVSVVTDPPRARVLIDGQPRGTSPLTLTDLPPAEYKISVGSDTSFAERTVTVKPGSIESLVFSLPKASTPLAGWLAVSAPFDVQILEDNTVVGIGNAARIMLPAGRHSLALVNQGLEYQETRTADVAAGKTATIRIDAPKVPLSINARPWADVAIDGANVGQTPIANVSLGIGPHEVVFRHPQLGERRQTVVLKTHGPNRIAVDLTK